MNVRVHDTSRATYSSSEWTTTIENLRDGGWAISDEDQELIGMGESLTLYSPNGMRKIVIELE